MNNWCICWFFMLPLNAELNPICHLLALLGGATIVVVNRLRVKQPRSDVDHSSRSTAKVNSEWICTSVPSICLHGVDKDTFPLGFFFIVLLFIQWLTFVYTL